MGTMTIELRKIIESGYELPLDDYEIFDENYREILNNRIINYFYFREIAFGTVAKFNFKLKNKMDLIMPKYNALYISKLMANDPLLTFQTEQFTNQNRNVDSKTSDNLTELQDETRLVDETREKTSNVSSDSESIMNSNKIINDESEDSLNENRLVGSKTSDNIIESQQGLTEMDEKRDQTGSLSNTSESLNNTNNLVTDEGKESASQQATADMNSKRVGAKTPNEDLSTYDVNSFTYADEVEVSNDDNLTTQNTDTESVNTQESVSTGIVSNESEGTTQNNETITNTVDDTKNMNREELKDHEENVSVNSDSQSKKTNEENENMNNIVTSQGAQVNIIDLSVKYAEVFETVDMMIINELKDLFMLVYN